MTANCLPHQARRAVSRAAAAAAAEGERRRRLQILKLEEEEERRVRQRHQRWAMSPLPSHQCLHTSWSLCLAVSALLV